MVLVSILEHFEKLFYSIPYNVLLGYIHLVGIIAFLLYLAVRYRNDLWEGVKGVNHILEMPEVIVSFTLICYINIILAHVFLGLPVDSAVFFSIDAIIFFGLTGRAYMNRNGGNDSTKKVEEAKPMPEPSQIAEEAKPTGPIEAKPDNIEDKDAFIA